MQRVSTRRTGTSPSTIPTSSSGWATTSTRILAPWVPRDVAARVHLGPEPTTLDDYRNRYARYKTDVHLQAAHATCPWFVVWDDHEVENNYAGQVPQDAVDQPTFGARIRAAYQAWWEHQPVRLDPPAVEDQEYRIYRDVAVGRADRVVPARRSPVPQRSDMRRRSARDHPRMPGDVRSGPHDAGRRAGGMAVRQARRVDLSVERDRQSGGVR